MISVVYVAHAAWWEPCNFRGLCICILPGLGLYCSVQTPRNIYMTATGWDLQHSSRADALYRDLSVVCSALGL